MAIHSSGYNWASFVRKAAFEVDKKFPRRDWTSTYPYHGEMSPVGAYAVDYLVSNLATGKNIANYLWANRKRLGVRYVVWNRKIISETGPVKDRNKWVAYWNGLNPDPSRAHLDHVHASHYWNGTYVPPALTIITKPISFVLSKFKGAVKTRGYNGNYPTHVKVVQYALKQLGYKDVTVDGVKGPKTISAMNNFLAKHGWPEATGRILTLRQLDRVIWEAEKLQAGTQYPPRAEN